MSELRKVLFKYYDITPKSFESKEAVGWVENCKGYFHRWGEEMYETNSEIGTYTIAIVEDEDGNVFSIQPAHLIFITSLSKSEKRSYPITNIS